MIRLPTSRERNVIYNDAKATFNLSDENLKIIMDFIFKEMVSGCFIHVPLSKEEANHFVKELGKCWVVLDTSSISTPTKELKLYGEHDLCPSYMFATVHRDLNIKYMLPTKNGTAMGIRDTYGSILYLDEDVYRIIRCFFHYTSPTGFKYRLEELLPNIDSRFLFKVGSYLIQAFTNLKDKIRNKG